MKNPKSISKLIRFDEETDHMLNQFIEGLAERGVKADKSKVIRAAIIHMYRCEDIDAMHYSLWKWVGNFPGKKE